MRSIFLKSLCLLALAAGEGLALSLYDTAPAIGLPESKALQYSLSVNVGYDDNINSSTNAKTKSEHAGASLSASYSDFESTTKKHFSATLGATYYFKRAYSTNKQWFSNNSISAGLTHSFSDRCSYSLNASLRYQPEPDYSNGISASRAQGDCINWSLSNAVTKSIDSRWSWTLNASTSGNYYAEKEYEYDDRRYISFGASLNVRTSELVSYSLNCSYRWDFKKSGYGPNSNNLYFTLSTNRSLTPYSSMNMSVGMQEKFIKGQRIWTPSIRGGYNRKVAEGLSLNFYVSLDNENVNTYRGMVGSYLSNPAWRVGVNASYIWTPDISFNFGCSYYTSNYGRGEGGLSSYRTSTVTPNVGISFRMTDKLRGNLHYTYTLSDSTRGYYASRGQRYGRNNIVFSTSYSF